uniref:Uncharacterized protein n=1 Tax=Rhizophora mucronata TaxID=61149 RepID=A0A2P2Q1H8_RHIMU
MKSMASSMGVFGVQVCSIASPTWLWFASWLFSFSIADATAFL